ncbi:hypothetical protein C8T65DRAFT_826142 [Cerioporus squamosus]|nr:hypothetical protein C8T65DRAFT_826142 [Cerioporus squamosus]
MSHLIPPQEEKKDTRTSRALPVDHTWPEEEQSGQTFTGSAQATLVPPQEEKADVAGLRGEKGRLDQALDRVEDQINKHRIERDGQASNDPAASKQQRDSVLSGAAGITGEDLGVAENQRLV